MKQKTQPTKSAPGAAGPEQLCYTRNGFAAALSLSVRTVDRMIAAKEIAGRHIHGKVVRIPRAEAERILQGKAASAGHEIKPPRQP